jgi:hypothetical protein
VLIWVGNAWPGRFVALYAAESQVILVASLLPVFIAALAIGALRSLSSSVRRLSPFWLSLTDRVLPFFLCRDLAAFWNGFWMSVGGYLFVLCFPLPFPPAPALVPLVVRLI